MVRPRHRHLLVLPLLLALGCGDPDRLGNDAAEVFKSCDEAALNLMAAKHNMQHVFAPCGSNEFKDFAWNKAFTDLYVRGESGPWLRRINTREHFPLQLGKPTSKVVWFNDNMLAYPTKGKRSWEINVYDTSQQALNLIGIKQLEPQQLQHGEAADDVLFLAREAEGRPLDVYRMSANTALVERAFPWVTPGAVKTFTYRRKLGIACIGYDKEGTVPITICYDRNGTELHRFPRKSRASVSMDGRFVMVEGPGKPLTVFKDPEAAKSAPAYLDREIVPESLWIVQRSNPETEHLVEGVYGRSFEWFDAKNYWGSFLLWGFDGEHTNSNVVTGDFAGKMRGMGLDVSMAGADPRKDLPAPEAVKAAKAKAESGE